MPTQPSSLLYTPANCLGALQSPALRAALAQVGEFCALEAAEPPRWPGGSTVPEIAALREACEFDQKRFAETFFDDYCAVPFSPMHEEFFATAARRLRSGERGWRDATAAPRGGGKTTVRVNIQLCHAICYATEPYILICSANAALAVDKVKGLRDLFTQRPKLREAYGDLRTEHWRQGDFVTANGCRVQAFTPKSAARGYLWGRHRPSLIMLDDAEDDEAVLTEYQRRQTFNWFNEKVMKLGDGRTNIDVIGTILHPQSLLAGLLKNPGYTRKHYRAVVAFSRTPESWALWDEWRRRVLDLANDARLDDARAFYEANEAAMLDGADVLWPHKETYYTLMLSRLVEGEAAFWKEKQNSPLADSRRTFDLARAGYCEVRVGEVVRADGTLVPWVDLVAWAAYWDPTPDKKRLRGSDYACCVVLAKDRYGYLYVIDVYLAQTGSTDAQMDAIAALLFRWQVPVIGMEANSFQGLLKQGLREKLEALAQTGGTGWDCTVLPVVNTRNKALRIQTMEPLVANHWLQFAQDLPLEYFTQFAEFTPGVDGQHDDAPDATEGGIRTINGMLDHRSAAAA